MVVLVRCKDDSYSVAMESRLDELANLGLITAYLRDGDWVTLPRERRSRRVNVRRVQPLQRQVAAVA